MHGFCAQLKFNIDARRPNQRGVQRLVAVDLGNRDMVFEFAWDRFVELVQYAQTGVAVDQIGQQHAHAINVSDLRKTQMFATHLLVDGIERFFSPKNTDVQMALLESGFDFELKFL